MNCETPNSVAFCIVIFIRNNFIGENISHKSVSFSISDIFFLICKTMLSRFIEITSDHHSPLTPSKTVIKSLTFILKTFFKK